MALASMPPRHSRGCYPDLPLMLLTPFSCVVQKGLEAEACCRYKYPFCRLLELYRSSVMSAARTDPQGAPGSRFPFLGTVGAGAAFIFARNSWEICTAFARADAS